MLDKDTRTGPGQPPYFESPEDMQVLIDAYFERCDVGEEALSLASQGRFALRRRLLGQPVGLLGPG